MKLSSVSLSGLQPGCLVSVSQPFISLQIEDVLWFDSSLTCGREGKDNKFIPAYLPMWQLHESVMLRFRVWQGSSPSLKGLFPLTAQTKHIRWDKHEMSVATSACRTDCDDLECSYKCSCIWTVASSQLQEVRHEQRCLFGSYSKLNSLALVEERKNLSVS